MKIKFLLLFICFWGVSFLYSQQAQAYFSNFDTADLIPRGTYRLGLEPQVIVTKEAGANVILHLDTGASETSNLRFLLGSGIVTFQAGAFYKQQLFPDYENQPAIAIFGGVLYGSRDGISSLNFRVHPEISKKFQTDSAGEWTPYGAIPFGISSTNGTGTVPIQLALGARWLPPGLKHMSFVAEAGLELNQAFNYISVGMLVPFESFETLRFD